LHRERPDRPGGAMNNQFFSGFQAENIVETLQCR
jgi:hypothetical protein